MKKKINSKASHSALVIHILFIVSLIIPRTANCQQPEDGYQMWLRYNKVKDKALLAEYRKTFNAVILNNNSPTMGAIKKEIEMGLNGLLANDFHFFSSITEDGTLVFGTPENSEIVAGLKLEKQLEAVGDEGFIITNRKINGFKTTVVASNTDIGVLYGTFHLLRLIQTNQPLSKLEIKSSPKIQCRVANHWDNADRSVERGYAGQSLWDWRTLPNYKNPRYTDYARFTASLGMNGVVINNVNADARFLSEHFLEKIAALADIFRPYGIKVYLSINFNSPQLLGNLNTADPLNEKVIAWWNEKTKQIYTYIPDLGGFLVKADSEGQPGPNTYGRSHADGANMLAQALKPYDGIVMWRAFVYGEKQADRIREAYDEFTPLDGKFDNNVIVQVKKGPLDFMPHEPFSPLFGAMPNTNTMIEFQITQEYLGNGNHLLYKGEMYSEILNSDTYAKGKGSSVGDVLAGKIFDYNITGMAGVTNPGTDRNWTGHTFVQSSWYAYGRLAWDYALNPDDIAEEWIRMTFSNEEEVVETIKTIMSVSAEAGINYREPLGLTHIGTGSHYGPAPWSGRSKRFHQANAEGIGFDRTKTGSKAIEQYKKPLKTTFGDINQVPEEFLLWFHHVSWDYKMKSGKTLWEELVSKYYTGVEQVRFIQKEWSKLEDKIDQQRFLHVKALLEIQEKDAVRWRNSCVLYFQSLSGKPIPENLPPPEHNLEYYKKLEKIIYVP